MMNHRRLGVRTIPTAMVCQQTFEVEVHERLFHFLFGTVRCIALISTCSCRSSQLVHCNEQKVAALGFVT